MYPQDPQDPILVPTSAEPLPDAGPSPLAEPPIPPTPPASLSHRIFYGPFGLRAGWSLLIYFAILSGIVMSVRAVQIHIQHKHAAAQTQSASAKPAPKPDPNKPGELLPGLIGETIFFAVFFLLSWLMAAIEGRKLSAFGLGGARPLSRFLMGGLWGLIAMALLIGSLRALHLLAFDSILDHGWRILAFGAAQFLLFFLVGLTEEYVFRGYLQFTLTRGLVSLGNLLSPPHARAIAFWIAATITSAIFYVAHTHNSGENALGLASVFLAGVLLLVALWRTGSLWWAIGFHTTWDWSQSFLYGVPDSGGLVQGRLFATHALGNPTLSGGTAGPEGSALCLPVILLVILVLFFTHPSPMPPLEPKSRKLDAPTPLEGSLPIYPTEVNS